MEGATSRAFESRRQRAAGIDGSLSLAAARFQLRPKRRKLLSDAVASLLAGEDPDTVVLPELYRALAAESIVDASLGLVVTEGEDGMRTGFVEGFPPEVARRCLRLDFGEAVCATAASTRRGMHVTDIQRSLDPLADLVRSAGMTAYACEPLIVGDRLLGTLAFASNTRRAFDAEDLILFRAVARHVAQARDRDRASKRAKDREPRAAA